MSGDICIGRRYYGLIACFYEYFLAVGDILAPEMHSLLSSERRSGEKASVCRRLALVEDYVTDRTDACYLFALHEDLRPALR